MDQEIGKDIIQSTSTPSLASSETSSVNLDCALNFETSSADPPGEDEYYDAVILYCEKDYEKAESIVKEINKIETTNGNFAKSELYEFVFVEHPEKFARLEKIFKRCSYIFILCTEAFGADDNETNYMANECVMNSILNKDKNQPWQVVPITDTSVKLPFGLNSLQPIKWRRKYALTQITKYIEKGVYRKLVRSQTVPAAISKSYNFSKSDLSSVCSGYESQLEQEGLSTFHLKDDMDMSSFKCTRPLQESHPRTEFQESMLTSALQSTKVSSHENQAISKLQNSMETLSLQCTKASLQEPQENMATLSFQSTKPSLQENQSVVDSQDIMTTPSLQSTKPSLQQNQSIPDCQDSMATPSLQSTKPSLQQNQSIPDCQDSMATPSLQSTKPSLQQNQSIPDCQDSMATPSLQSTKPSLQQNQSIPDCQDSMATPSLQSTKPSLQQNQSIPDCQDSMATPSLQSTKPSLQQNQFVTDCQDSMPSSYFQSANSSMELSRSEESIPGLVKLQIDTCSKENNKDKKTSCVIS